MGTAREHARPALNAGGVKKRSVTVAGHQTSLSLEAPFWDDLRAVARRRGVSLNALVASVDATRQGNLSSALRVFVLDCYRRGELGAGAALADKNEAPLPSSLPGLARQSTAIDPRVKLGGDGERVVPSARKSPKDGSSGP